MPLKGFKPAFQFGASSLSNKNHILKITSLSYNLNKLSTHFKLIDPFGTERLRTNSMIIKFLNLFSLNLKGNNGVANLVKLFGTERVHTK